MPCPGPDKIPTLSRNPIRTPVHMERRPLPNQIRPCVHLSENKTSTYIVYDITLFQNWSSNNSRGRWLSKMVNPGFGKMVQQLLQGLHQNTPQHTSKRIHIPCQESSYPIPTFRPRSHILTQPMPQLQTTTLPNLPPVFPCSLHIQVGGEQHFGQLWVHSWAIPGRWSHEL